MTRVLITYLDAAERKTAARHAVCLAGRGVHVDLMAGASVPPYATDRYDRICAATSPSLAAYAATVLPHGVGSVRIIGHDLGDVPVAWAMPFGVVLGALVAVALAVVGAPWLYPPLIGVVVAVAVAHVLRVAAAPPTPSLPGLA